MLRSAVSLLVLLAGISLACSAESRDTEGAAAIATRAENPAPSQPAKATVQSKRPRNERPLPAFTGSTFDGQRLAISSLLGRRLVLFFFEPDEEDAVPALEAVGELAPLQAKHNFEIVGIATRSPTPVSRKLIAAHPTGYKILNDASGKISRKLGLKVPVAFLFVDAEGYVTSGMGGATAGEGAVAALEAGLREKLRLPARPTATEPTSTDKPSAPLFSGVPIDSAQKVNLAELRGRPVILIFFLYTCPHCHHALEFLKGYLAEFPEEKRPVLIGVSVAGSSSVVRNQLKELDLDYFPVLLDPDKTIRSAYQAYSGVPEIVLIDPEGKISARVRGWRDDRDPPLLRMRVAKLAGEPVPMLLHGTGYSGNEFCAVCHETQEATWRFTEHAGAFETLLKHNAERDSECVGCHVVGFEKEGGYAVHPATPYLEDVGCETCHGRGGPHLSPEFAHRTSYEETCVGCHDSKHSLGFDYATFLPHVSHANNVKYLALPAEERNAILLARGGPRDTLMPSSAEFVGSDACQSCHPAEFETWSEQPHAHAYATLEAEQKSQDPTCLACHTTGFGRAGGFALEDGQANRVDLARVGCESCHGPGGDHVGKDARRVGTILSLADKCDSCVILEICGSCHDDANDPGFEFVVEKKIEAQQHGTIEPGTGKPKERADARMGLTGPGSIPSLAAQTEQAWNLADRN